MQVKITIHYPLYSTYADNTLSQYYCKATPKIRKLSWEKNSFWVCSQSWSKDEKFHNFTGKAHYSHGERPNRCNFSSGFSDHFWRHHIRHYVILSKTYTFHECHIICLSLQCYTHAHCLTHRWRSHLIHQGHHGPKQSHDPLLGVNSEGLLLSFLQLFFRFTFHLTCPTQTPKQNNDIIIQCGNVLKCNISPFF